MLEIMEDRGMNASDFYMDDNYRDKDDFHRLTKTKFHNVLNGTTKHPANDFILSFCKIAGITVGEFYKSEGPDEYMISLLDEEKEIIELIRDVRRGSMGDRVYEYVKRILKGLDGL